MAQPLLGEIQIFAGNFAPTGWEFCNGQLLQIAQNSALFSILGTVYGGDGETTFGLPNLQGRAPMHVGSGNGPGLTPRHLGQKGGVEEVTLTDTNMPAHGHALTGDGDDVNSTNPQDNYLGTGAQVYAPPANLVSMAAGTLPEFVGGGQSHNNVHPVLTFSFIIATSGEFPNS